MTESDYRSAKVFAEEARRAVYERVHRGPFHEVKNVQPARNLRKRKSEIFSLSRAVGVEGCARQSETKIPDERQQPCNQREPLPRPGLSQSAARSRNHGNVEVPPPLLPPPPDCRDFNENLHSTAHATPPPPVFSECLSDLCHVRRASSREYRLNSVARVKRKRGTRQTAMGSETSSNRFQSVLRITTTNSKLKHCKSLDEILRAQRVFHKLRLKQHRERNLNAYI